MRALLSMLLLTGCGLPSLSGEEVFGLELKPRAWVYGTVSNAQTGTPLAEATVQLSSASARTDANGAFRIEGITTDEEHVSASRAGFQSQTIALSLRPAANALDIQLAPVACGGCSGGQVCTAGGCVQSASVTGDIVDACTGAAIEVRVTIDGKSTCSAQIKGFWQLKDLTPGGPQTIAAGRPGYQPFTRQVTLVSGFNALEKVELVRIGGCSAPIEPWTCTCTTSNCQ